MSKKVTVVAHAYDKRGRLIACAHQILDLLRSQCRKPTEEELKNVG